MNKVLNILTTAFFATFVLFSNLCLAGFANYNSILIGNRAAGMGGAYTSLTGDPSANSFYNPSTLARMQGNTLSASVTLFNKYDVEYGKENEFDSAPLRVNQGSIVPIPASGGSVYTFKNFAFGLSIVFPDIDQFNGEVRANDNTNSYLNLKDTSLWVGGSLALNVTEEDAIGLTMYYTSRSYTRSVTDRTEGTETTITSEEKNFSQNSLIYILGYTREISPQWRVGLSYRLPSLPVSGEGSSFRSQISTDGTDESTSLDLKASTKIPERLALGLSYETVSEYTWAFDIHYYGKADYRDLSSPSDGDLIRHRPTLNASLGAEIPLLTWLDLRAGVFSNLSSHTKIDENPSQRQPDHIDMWGFSTNLAIATSAQSTLTLGGYYTGGKGYSVQQIDQQLQKVKKNVQIFSFLVGTSYQF